MSCNLNCRHSDNLSVFLMEFRSHSLLIVSIYTNFVGKYGEINLNTLLITLSDFRNKEIYLIIIWANQTVAVSNRIPKL